MIGQFDGATRGEVGVCAVGKRSEKSGQTPVIDLGAVLVGPVLIDRCGIHHVRWMIMRQSWLLLGLLGSVASSGPADKQEFVVTRQELRRQVYLYNGWMADVLRSTRGSGTITRDPLPLDCVIPALLGQLEERTLSPEDLAAERDRLTRWIGILATARRFHAGEPSPEAPGSKLPIASVALHFCRPKPGSSLTRDFRDESGAYARLRRLAEPLLSEFRVVQEEFHKANPTPSYKEFEEYTRRFLSSKEVAPWLSKVQRNLDAIDRECASIGYHVSAAWKIREEAIRGRESFS
jgi:hypothetical protein